MLKYPLQTYDKNGWSNSWIRIQICQCDMIKMTPQTRTRRNTLQNNPAPQMFQEIFDDKFLIASPSSPPPEYYPELKGVFSHNATPSKH